MSRQRKREERKPRTGPVEKYREKWVWKETLPGYEIGRSERDSNRYFIKDTEGNQKVINKEGMFQWVVGFARAKKLEINEKAETLDELINEIKNLINKKKAKENKS